MGGEDEREVEREEEAEGEGTGEGTGRGSRWVCPEQEGGRPSASSA